MRNHDEKIRDMARSVLPSNARKTARWRRAKAHHKERARVNRMMADLRRAPSPYDLDGDLYARRGDLWWMVFERRNADKVAPLIRWARCRIERDPRLAAASPEDREAHFRALLPAGVIGEHALTHLDEVFEGRPRRRWRGGGTPQPPARSDVELVEEIVAAGLHGALNRRIRSTLSAVIEHTVTQPAARVIDGDHPAPGLLLPHRTVIEHRRRDIRFLAGAHDAAAFARDVTPDVLEILRAFHAEWFAGR